MFALIWLMSLMAQVTLLVEKAETKNTEKTGWMGLTATKKASYNWILSNGQLQSNVSVPHLKEGLQIVYESLYEMDKTLINTEITETCWYKNWHWQEAKQCHSYSL